MPSPLRPLITSFFLGTLVVSFFLPVNFLSAVEKEKILQGVLVEGINVDLREPTFCEGVLSTQMGGVITGPDIRIQARKMTYTRKMIDGEPVCQIEAEEEIMLEIGEHFFIGERLEYDFQKGTGVIYSGRTALGPWFIGGDVVELEKDGSYIIHKGFVTTSENSLPEWQITASYATLQEYQFLKARQVQFTVGHFTPFWLGSLALDLDSILDSPVRYSGGWGGKQGPRLGMVYEVFAWNRWKTYLRLDYRLRRGPGAGFETRYRSEDHKQFFYTLNYIARDSSIFNSKERFRYRFQGAYGNRFADDKISIDFTYDKMSDKWVPDDYADQSLEIETAGRTQLDMRRQEEDWITTLMARVRVNNFETIKQELPTAQLDWKSFCIPETGIISDNRLRTSYLDFVYANNVPDVDNYSSTRLSYDQRLYRPFAIGPAFLTPEAGSTTIFYGNSPEENERWVLLGKFGCDFNLPFHRFYDNKKHVFVPYTEYSYYTFPTTSPDDHYIFDIEDGWYRLNMMRFGAHQSFYRRSSDGTIRRFLFADIWANAFFDTPTIPRTIPKAYSSFVWNFTPHLRQILDMAWDFDVNNMSYLNIRTEWTISKNFAVSAEYRHRNAFDWRKVDRSNFILDSFRTIEQLRASTLSDRRSIALLHFFYRIHPNWAIEYEARHGWCRENRTRFTEFEIDVIATLRSAAHLKFSYQHKESEDRIAVYFFVGMERPDHLKPMDLIPFVEF